MKNFVVAILALMLAAGVVCRGEVPYCHARLYDETEGLSQRSVKQIVAAPDGFVWLATWDGLNRFDGYDFRVIRPQLADTVRRYSQRFRDIHVAADSSLWGRLDDRLVRLSVPAYEWDDVHARVERALGRELRVDRWVWNQAGDTIAAGTKEGEWVTISAADPGSRPAVGMSRPAFVPASAHGYDARVSFDGIELRDVAYTRRDRSGHQWMVTRGGRVLYADAEGMAPTEVADLGVADKSLTYCTTDLDGGLWFRSRLGAHRLDLGTLPYTPLRGGNEGRILYAVTDLSGRIWVAEPDRKAIAVYADGIDGEPLYVSPDGELRRGFVPFGRAVYSLQALADGTVMAGAKPDGLFKIDPDVEVTHLLDGTVYDIIPHDGLGLLTVNLGEGIKSLGGHRYEIPRGGVSARKGLLSADTLLLAATTGGLLALNPTDPAAPVRLHVTEPGQPASLPGIAVTDILQLADSVWLVSTESDGVSLMRGDPFGEASFAPVGPWLRSHHLGLVQSLTRLPGSDLVLATGLSSLFTFDPSAPDSTIVIYGPAHWHSRLRFSDMRPLALPDGRLLAGTDRGGVLVNLADTLPRTSRMPLYFTSVSLGAGGDSILPPSVGRLTLTPDRRSLTLRVAALEYGNPEDIHYSFRINGGEWSAPAPERTLTLFDLAPGEYMVEARVTDTMGRLVPGSTAYVTLDVVPRWHETIWARILLWVAVALAVGGVVWTRLYILDIKRKQRETLEAYLDLVSRNVAPGPEPEETPAQPAVALGEQDTLFMDAVTRYVTEHMADSEADVDGMAEAAGVSRSNLTRKMRSLMGVSPADFMRRTRLSHAAKLLTDTRLAVKEIAFDCGFADLNYFGKCFKAAYGTTPTGYRRGMD